MKKYLGIIMMALWLSGCDGEKTLSEGKYLVEDIRVVFDNSKHPEANENRDNLQEHIAKNLKSIKNDLYFNLTPTQVSYYSADGEYTEEMKDNRIRVNGMWHTLNITGKNTVTFVSDKSAACAFYYCEITMVLKKTEEQSPALLKIQQRFEEHKKAYQAWLLEEKAVFNRASMDDFPGIPFYPEEYFTIKLPFSMYDKLSLQEHGMYIRKMGRLLIDRENKDTQIYSYRDKQNNTDIDLFTVSAAKEDFNLASWLEGQKGVLFQSENGAAYDNQQGKLEAVYFQYDEAKQRYFIGVANAEDTVALANAFAVLRTMDERYRGEQALSMYDLALSQPELEAKYGVKIADEFTIAEMHQAIWKALEQRMEKPERFIKRSMSKTRIEIRFPSEVFKYDVYFTISPQSIPELIAETKEIVPEGKDVDNLFIYGDSAFVGYEYNVNVGSGLTLQFLVPKDAGTPLERLMFLHVLRQLDVTRFPAISAQEKKNLFTYGEATSFKNNLDNRYFKVEEGLIDSTGKLIVKNPDDGYFEFTYESPHIQAIHYKSKGEGNYSRVPGVTVFDEKGKLISHHAD
ncbi:hypothetical protein LES60_12130 [Pectobacterium brasiliense]|uniref:hypothetical protein n=1 Tax=Pectobacterium brasiliense TaxID=180957 RepID=UPI001CE11834|nr:hypothetical protein [Pectobacterium brasiliense]MCA5920539.1 hypothetical protein [Pectobacterium brasiliense]MCA5927398.1 hypothetical protein [Pectobacterium brasiliense]MCA5936561.1 hypothetical protein [Pectobacterium brasiliense]MCA5940469.1 hypothetical protein [Pectobacterium brasiliense]MCA5945485.1 hypothetical protein [Pectobacterium brasiliense]